MIKGSLIAKVKNGKIQVRFMQRGDLGAEANLPVKIYRRNADEINFSTGMCGDNPGFWTEYVENQSMDDSRVSLIFEGKAPYAYSYCEYNDETAEVGHIYLYWVTQEVDGVVTKIGPVACKLRDSEIWWSYERTCSEMHRLCADYPSLVTMGDYGESTRHRRMLGLKIGNQENTVILAGAIHASEPGPELLLRAVRFIIETRPELLAQIGFAVLPAVNIDVREETVEGEPFYLRKNPNGVDLNRNFDFNWATEYVYGYANDDPDASTYHGPYPGSENETRAAMNFVRSVKNPLALFVYDSCSVITEDWLLLDTTPNDKNWESHNRLAGVYSKAFRADYPECGSFTAEPITYPTPLLDCFEDTGMPHGTFEGWVHFTFDIPAFSLQTANSEEGRCNADDHVSRELLDRFSRRHAYALIAVLEDFIRKQR